MSVSKTRATEEAANPSNLFSKKLHKQQQEKALSSLYHDQGFREAVKYLRKMIPVNASLKDAPARKIFRYLGRMILSRWGLNRFPHEAQSSYKWLSWLWRNWDPDKEKKPACPSTILEPTLSGWMVHCFEHPSNFHEDRSRHRDHMYAWVALTLFPGVSRAQAEKAFDRAFNRSQEPMTGKTVPKSSVGRPGMSISELKSLHGVFEEVGLPEARPTKRQADKLRQVRATIERSSDASANSLRPLSDSSIKAHYQQWRITKGAPPRRYYTEPTSR